MDMQERIDTLIKMRTEKPEYANEWERLRNALQSRPNVGLTSEQITQLDKAFADITRKEFLDGWDRRFMEVVIDGQNVHGTQLYFEDNMYMPEQKYVPRNYGDIQTAATMAKQAVQSSISDTIREGVTKVFAEQYAKELKDTVSPAVRREIDKARAKHD